MPPLANESLSPLSSMFADFMLEHAADCEHPDILKRTAAWLSSVCEQGDSCLDIKKHAQSHWHDGEGQTPSFKQWAEILLSAHCVGKENSHAPMILDGHLLYLYRFWNDEQQVAEGIRQRLGTPISDDSATQHDALSRLFPNTSDAADWQKVAAALVLRQRFAVISGGPGTGKTTSLVKVLALLLEQKADMHICLAAPTGKAAARMMDSIRHAKQATGERALNTSDSVLHAIPEEATTLHRLLGFSPRGYRHHNKNPLMLDCLVIDEASMVDLPMMARILDALPKDARLILLGDRDQLSSVEAGNVLGDITGLGQEIVYPPEDVAQLAAWTGYDATALSPVTQQASQHAPAIARSIALLRTSHRFHDQQGIGSLAYHVNQRNTQQALRILQHDESGELTWNPNAELSETLQQIVHYYRDYLQKTNIHDALIALEQCRVLCAVRQGAWGVERINQAIQELLLPDSNPTNNAIHGMPIMIRRNHYDLKLFNGDTGLIWTIDGKLCACFQDSQQANGVRTLPLHLLTHYDLCWAMTVHQSQGSEFERVFLILPEQTSHHMLNKELMYTAITRARSAFHLHAAHITIQNSIAQRLQRSSGLAERLEWRTAPFI